MYICIFVLSGGSVCASQTENCNLTDKLMEHIYYVKRSYIETLYLGIKAQWI